MQDQLSQNSILVDGARPLGSYVNPWDARHQHWRRLWKSSDSVYGKMSTPSRGRSSAKGDEDYHEWLEAIERRQLESERQMQALLQEIARLREENVVLQIQASSTGPPRGQRSRGQGANSRPELESIYLGTAGAIPESCNVRPQGQHTPMHQAPQEESSDSTRLSSKRQRDKRPQLSDTMRARLGPQEPGKTRPPVATTWGAHPTP